MVNLFKSRSKSFKLEPIFNDKPSTSSNDSGHRNAIGGTVVADGDVPFDDLENFDYAKLVESKSTRRKRYFSISIIALSSFIFNLSFSIVLTSAKPYLDEMDPGAGNDFLGLFIAAQPLAQFFFSPLFGYLGNKFRSVRYLLMSSMVFLSAGFALYACVSALPEPRRWILFSARFLIGAAGGSITLCFSYIASATTTKERTTAMALFGMAQSSAFVVGPAIQAAFSPLGPGEVNPIGNNLYLNMFTAPSWLSVILGLLMVIFLLPGIFTEYNIAKEEGDYLTARKGKKDAEKDEAKMRPPDKVGLIANIIIFASVNFNFVFLESVATLLVMEQLGWEETKAIVFVGAGFAIAGFYVALLYVATGPLARKVKERTVLLIGIVFLTLGPIALYPYDGELPPLRCPPNATFTENMTTTMAPLIHAHHRHPLYFPELLYKTVITHDLDYEGSIREELPGLNCTLNAGCPIYEQEWCGYLPAIQPWQMITGFVLICTGFPFGGAISNSIYSKILGPFPQGTWMGILSAGSCLARVLCPICVTNLYAAFGTWAAFGFTTGVMVIVLVIFFLSYKRLVPYKYEN